MGAQGARCHDTFLCSLPGGKRLVKVERKSWAALVSISRANNRSLIYINSQTRIASDALGNGAFTFYSDKTGVVSVC